MKFDYVYNISYVRNNWFTRVLNISTQGTFLCKVILHIVASANPSEQVTGFVRYKKKTFIGFQKTKKTKVSQFPHCL